MKLFYVTVLGLMIGATSFAQKGSFYVGGQVGFSSSTTKLQSTETGKSSSWSVSPEVGTFLTNNVQLGIGLNVGGSKQVTTGVYENNTSLYGATVYSRYFFGEGTKLFRPFVGVNLSAIPGKSETTNAITNLKTETDLFNFGANLNAGFAYAISPKVTVVGNLGVLGFNSQSEKFANGTKEKTNSFGFDLNSLGNRFNIGLYLTL
jgi:outer membrane protein W